MAYTTEAAIASALRDAHPWIGMKLAGGGGSTGVVFSLGSTWRTSALGNSPWVAGGIPPTSGGETLDRTSVGALPVPIPVAGKSRYLLRAKLSAAAANGHQNAMIYDRLVHCSGVSADAAHEGIAQTLNTVTLPARAIPAQVAMAIEAYGSVGSTSTLNVSVTYTNESGVSGRVSPAIAVLNISTANFGPLPLQSGDRGVQSVQSMTLTNTAVGNVTTTGLIGVTLYTPLFFINLEDRSNLKTNYEQDWRMLGLPLIPDDACISLAAQDSTFNTNLAFEAYFGYA